MRYKFIQKFYLIIFSIVFFAFFIEISFRIYDFGFNFKKKEQRIAKGELLTAQDVIRFLIKTGRCVHDPLLIWRFTQKIKQYEFNRFGFSGKEEFLLSKKGNTYRIIVLGGSHPFGIGINFNETYSRQLENLFKKDAEKWNKTIEIINAAVPGHSTLQVLNFLKYYIINFKPDLVIIYAGNNDKSKLTPYWPLRDSEIIKQRIYNKITISLLDKSHFLWYYYLFIKKCLSIKKVDLGQRVTKEENYQNLTEMKEIAEINNFKIIFLSQVMKKNGKLIRGFGAKVEPFLDIYNELKNIQNIDEYFYDSLHGTVKGHKEIAKIIYNYFVSNPQIIWGKIPFSYQKK